MNSEDFYAAADSPTAGDLPERFTALAAANYLEAETPELEQLLPRLRRRRLGRNLMNTGVTLTTLFAVAGLVLTASHLTQGEPVNPAERGAAGLTSSLVCGQTFPSATEVEHFAPISAEIAADNRWTAYVPALVEQEWTQEVGVDGSLKSVAPQGTEVYLLDKANRVIGYSVPFLNAANTGSVTVATDDEVRISAPLAGEFELCAQTQAAATDAALVEDAQPTAFWIGVIQRAQVDAALSQAAILAPAPLLRSNAVTISTDYGRFAEIPGHHDAVAEISVRERILINELELLQKAEAEAKIDEAQRTIQELTKGLEP